MAYEPKEWVCGETITADGLNNIEEGIQEALECCGGGADNPIEIVNFESLNYGTSYISELTYAEIKQKIMDGKSVMARLVVDPSNPMGITNAFIAYKAPYTLKFVDVSQTNFPQFQLYGYNNEDGTEWVSVPNP